MGFRLAIIGAGHMGQALIAGVLKKRLLKPAQILAIDKDSSKLRSVGRRTRARTSQDIRAARGAPMILIAVKPQDIVPVLKDLREALSRPSLVISIAAGVRTQALKDRLGRQARIIRAMPNLPAAVGEGVTGLFAASTATAADAKRTARLFGAVGEAFWVRRESSLDAVTAVTGSGPAYVFGLMAALLEGGKRLGLPPKNLPRIIASLVRGSATLALRRDKGPERLRREVTSKGGTTEAAFKVLTKRAWQQAMVDAIRAAHRRARQL